MEESERQALQQNYEEKVREELANLATYRQALAEEFKSRSLDDPETAARAKAEVIELVPDAASQLKWLINHADSESIRKDISKWVFELAMKTAGKNEEDDELTRMLKDLTKTREPVNDT